MRPTTLVPNRQYLSHGVFGEPKIYTFVRRDRQPCRAAVNVFQCDDYRGLNFPNDPGITHLTDYQVCKNIQPLPPLCDCGKEGCNFCAARVQLSNGGAQ